MINIRPISDLRNKFTEIEKIVVEENKEVYLTKNGYGSMVVMSIKKYEKLLANLSYNDYIEKALDEADRVAENNETEYYTQQELVKKLKGEIND